MKKKWMKLAAACLAAALLLPGAIPAQAAPAGEPVLRVGLAYGSSALAAANLENSVGSGYRLGYFDGDLSFVELAQTGTARISMLKTQNLYLSGGSYSAVQSAGAQVVGCYHIRLGIYADLTSAQAAAGAVSGGFPAWIDGNYEARTGAYATREEAQAACTAMGLAGEIVGTSSYGVSVVETGSTRILFQYDGGSAQPFGVMPDVTGESEPVTWFKGYKYYGGFRYERIGGGDLTVVNVVNMEDYVRCVITWEMGASWPKEALKAQACCARTYAARNQDRHAAYHFDVCSEVHCQAYHGTQNLTANSIQAASECEGVYIRYGGALAETVYSSSNGGASESAENVWNSAVPYLVGKLDPYEALVSSRIPNYSWSVTFTAEELATKLRAKGYICGSIVDFRVSETTPTGNVKAITFTDSAGKSWTFRKESARTLLGLRSQRYSVTGGGSGGGFYVDGGDKLDTIGGCYAISGDGTVGQISSVSSPYVITSSGVSQLTARSGGGDTYVISGTGYGHNVGMSQYGAMAMAEAGYTYDQILKFYFTGVELS